MLCERDASSARILEDRDFFFELKLDGVRIVAEKSERAVTLTYRSGRDATRAYPEIAGAVRALPEPRLVLDGEIIATGDDGRPDFERLARRIHGAGAPVAVSYVVFDVLVAGDRDLRHEPIEERKRVLAALVPEGTGGLLHAAPVFERGAELFRLCRERKLEGVVAKRRGSRYRDGERSLDWIKVKCEEEDDFVVIGWSDRSLDVGRWEDGELVARGSVGSGLDADAIASLHARLAALELPRSPATKGRLTPKPGRRFARPELVVSVRFAGVTSDGLLRHPVFRGVREDLALPPGLPPELAEAAARILRGEAASPEEIAAVTAALQEMVREKAAR